MTAPKKALKARDSWSSIALVAVVSLLFGLLVLPYLKPQKSGLEGQPAPDFALPVIYGGEPGNRIRLSDLKGKAVVLDFWASWCGPCREQVPILDRVAKKLSTLPVVVVGVNTGDAREDALGFLESRQPVYASVFDEGTRVQAAYGVRTLPTLVILDEAGRVSAVRTRVVGERELESLIEDALAK